MKTVITFGVFDFLHLGHIRLFTYVRNIIGEPCRLVVAVQDGNIIRKYKPLANVFYSTEQRLEMIRALKIVDFAIVYTTCDSIIGKIDFDVFVRGEDQNNKHFIALEKWCLNNNKEVIRAPRTAGICSSGIKEEFICDFIRPAERTA